MASVESRAVSAELEWVAPAEIVEAARRHSETVLASHRLDMAGDTDGHLVHIDPRLTSAALAHILESAAAYSPAALPIIVVVRLPGDRLVIAVRDHGSGVPPAHLRVLVGQLGNKLESNPSHPRYVPTEPWVGFRFASGGE